MISKWRAALIFSAACLAAVPSASSTVIRSVEIAGNRYISTANIKMGSLLIAGMQFSDSLIAQEVMRIDSLYFSIGVLAVRIAADTSVSADDVALRFRIEEGERARVGTVAVNGAARLGEEKAKRVIRPAPGELFDPFILEESLLALLDDYNEAGYPYAQVWLTGFEYRDDANEIDLAVSVSEAERTVISGIVFEGLARTDSMVARKTSRLRPGMEYRRMEVERGRSYLRSSGYFESVGEARLERRGPGEADLVIPVKEARGTGTFQGAVGFSRKADGSYVASGAAGLALRNIAGSGRGAALDWLNDGLSYSRIALRYREPFLVSLPLSVDAEMTQVVQDSSYVLSSGALNLGVSVGPATTITFGVAWDQNVPEHGDLDRSVRQRLRLGVSRTGETSAGASLGVEGAYRRRYFEDGSVERDGELLYDFEASGSIPAFGAQSVFLRLASRGVFSKETVPLAEMYALGGANALRGYREAQFRGEKIAWGTVEYRFGSGGAFFLFDDVGAYESQEEGWVFKNGAGFGLRADSPLGIVALSFGVGERLSLSETRLHVSLAERF